MGGIVEITINGESADIVLDTEKTVGDALAGIELWLEGSGGRLSGLSLDGQELSAGALADCFNRDLSTVGRMDVRVTAWRDLALDALDALADLCARWDTTPFDERPGLIRSWNESPAATFLAEDIPDLAILAGRALAGDGIAPAELAGLVGDRARELRDPRAALEAAADGIDETAERLEAMPLDLQSGRDSRAAETMRRFAHQSERLFRILGEARAGSIPITEIDGTPTREFMAAFRGALDELRTAYDNRDAVLAGDLAEYEMAPRLRALKGSLLRTLRAGAS